MIYLFEFDSKIKTGLHIETLMDFQLFSPRINKSSS